MYISREHTIPDETDEQIGFFEQIWCTFIGFIVAIRLIIGLSLFIICVGMLVKNWYAKQKEQKAEQKEQKEQKEKKDQMEFDDLSKRLKNRFGCKNESSFPIYKDNFGRKDETNSVKLKNTAGPSPHTRAASISDRDSQFESDPDSDWFIV